MNSAKKTAPKKPKLVRDSFTIPKAEYTAIDALKARAMKLGVGIKKSELLRAGLMALSALGDAGLRAALAAVPTLKTGRPAAPTDKGQSTATPVKAAPVKAAPVKAPVKPATKPAARPAAKKATPKKTAPKKTAPKKAVTTKAPAPK